MTNPITIERIEPKIMLFQCTKKLLDELNIKPIKTDELPLFSWHANLLIIDRRKTIVLMNDSNRYVVVLHGLKAKDKKNIESVILSAIRETLLNEGIKNKVIESYLQASPEIAFDKTKDRSTVAKLNQACETAYYFSEYFTTESLNQLHVSRMSSAHPCFDKNKLIYPNEEMYRELELFAGQPVFQGKAIRIKVTLELEKHNVWRRLMIPYSISFDQLHHVIQRAFHWQDYHLHDFEIFDNNKPVINIVQSEEDFGYPSDIPRILETGVLIADYIPKYKRFSYRYDFGDGWVHIIEVEDLLFDYDKNYPVCLEGAGNTPPEDVGGEGGYNEFLKIINDPKHEEYEQMKSWASKQLYHTFNINQVNWALEHLLYR